MPCDDSGGFSGRHQQKYLLVSCPRCNVEGVKDSFPCRTSCIESPSIGLCASGREMSCGCFSRRGVGEQRSLISQIKIPSFCSQSYLKIKTGHQRLDFAFGEISGYQLCVTQYIRNYPPRNNCSTPWVRSVIKSSGSSRPILSRITVLPEKSD